MGTIVGRAVGDKRIKAATSGTKIYPYGSAANTANSVNNAFTGYVEVVPTTEITEDMMLVAMYSRVSTAGATAVEQGDAFLALGASGSEVDVYQFIPGESAGAMVYTLPIPIKIPSGSRISIRFRNSNGSTGASLRVRVQLVPTRILESY